MKKLMFAIAAVAAGAVFAEEAPAVTSANVVGYQTQTTAQQGFSYYLCTFDPIDGNAEGIDIQDILPSAAGGDIQFLNAAQGCSEYFYWYKASNGEAGPKGKKVKTDRAGLWFQQIYNWSTGKKTEEFVATRKIKSGESFQFSASQGVSLTFSGAVPTESVTMTAPAQGFNYWGNPFPTDVDIQTILPSAQGGDMQFLNSAQGCSEYYYWYKASNGEAGPKGAKVKTDKPGLWFQQIYNWSTGKKTSEFVATRQVKAGEGFQFSCSAGVSLTIPKPYSL